MPARTRQALVAFGVCLVLCGCTHTPPNNPSPTSAATLTQAVSSAPPSKSANQTASEAVIVKAYAVMWSFMAVQTPTRDIEAEFSPYMRNVRTNGTEGFLAQSEKYVNGVLNSGVVATGVPKFTVQSSRDASPLEGRPTVYVMGCADLSTVAMKNLETGATLAPIDPPKDPRTFTVEQFGDGWRVVESQPTQNTSPC
jgi:hypothetical protein